MPKHEIDKENKLRIALSVNFHAEGDRAGI